MTEDGYHKRRLANHLLHPETLMLGYGYDPLLSEGAVKPPVFLTSTFVFRSAEEGRDFFDYTAGRREPPKGEGGGLVYSRFNHPNSEIVEDRLAAYEGAEACTLFSSGMSAIATTILTFTRPGDVILHSQPLYGGTETLIAKTMTNYQVQSIGFADGVDEATIREAAEAARRKGPRGGDHDRDAVQSAQHHGRHQAGAPHRRRDRGAAEASPDHHVRQHAARAGLPAAAAVRRGCVGLFADQICRRPLGSHRGRGARQRTRSCGRSGNCAAPSARSSTRIRAGCSAARSKRSRCAWSAATPMRRVVAEFLRDHPRVAKVHYLPFLSADSPQRRVYRGAVHRRRLDLLVRHQGRARRGVRVPEQAADLQARGEPRRHRVARLHPGSTTHSGVPADLRARIGVSDATIRLSIGIEHADDLIADLSQALIAEP